MFPISTLNLLLLRKMGHHSGTAEATADMDVSQVPGTVHLVDLEQTAATRHASGGGSSRDIILVPTPSADPNDPLNWSPGRKRLHLVCLMM